MRAGRTQYRNFAFYLAPRQKANTIIKFNLLSRPMQSHQLFASPALFFPNGRYTMVTTSRIRSEDDHDAICNFERQATNIPVPRLSPATTILYHARATARHYNACRPQ